MIHNECRFAPFFRWKGQRLISACLLRPEKDCGAQRYHPKSPAGEPLTVRPSMLLSLLRSHLVTYQTPWEADSRFPHTSAALPLPSPPQNTVEKLSPREDGLVLGHSANELKTKGVSMPHGHLEAHQGTDALMGQAIGTEPAWHSPAAPRYAGLAQPEHSEFCSQASGSGH